MFPKGFYWGAATAAYQVEGGIENNDWAAAAREGWVPECGAACDHYQRFAEDFDIAAELGHTAHRFSIEWARIEPHEGEFDEAAIQHYREVLEALHSRGLTPYITLWHFTLPQWFAESGGFERADAPKIFARYCVYVVSQLHDLCQEFSTMNEPNVFASNGWLRGTWPPFKRFSLTDAVSITNSGRQHEADPHKSIGHVWQYWRVLHTLTRAHNLAYTAIKDTHPEVSVSVVKHVIVFAASRNPLQKIKAWVANQLWTHRFMRRTHRYCDSIGLNYYFYTKFGDTKEWRKTDMDWNFAPEHIYEALVMLSRYQKPLFVSEGGIADADDSDRAEYIEKQVRAVGKAIQDGVDVRGHLYWSLLDNYEWALGFDKRFGLVAVDFMTQERTIRPSAWVYKKIIENNTVPETEETEDSKS